MQNQATTPSPTAPEPSPFLVGRDEAARLIGVSTRTLDQLVADSVVPSVKLGGRRLFSPEALSRWVLDQVYEAGESA